MSNAELDQLERDVGQARARFTADLARLRSPSIYAEFKDEVVAQARHTKDEWVDKATGAAKEGAHSVLSEIKDRAAANPAAALAIGAGLAWHLARHPPVTTVLVGLGLMGLWRTNPHRPSRSAKLVTSAAEMAGAVKDKVEELRASDTAARAGELAESVKTSVVSAAESLAHRGAIVAQRAVHDHEERDKYLYGAAALALAAAVGIAVQRRVT